MQSGQRLIDCHFGGWDSQAFLSRGVFVCHVDLSQKNLREIRERFGSSGLGGYIAADLNQLPFKSGAFDVATSNDVYEHLDEIDMAACELKSIVRKPGRLAMVFSVKEN